MRKIRKLMNEVTEIRGKNLINKAAIINCSACIVYIIALFVLKLGDFIALYSIVIMVLCNISLIAAGIVMLAGTYNLAVVNKRAIVNVLSITYLFTAIISALIPIFIKDSNTPDIFVGVVSVIIGFITFIVSRK